MLDIQNAVKIFEKGTPIEHTALNHLSLHLDAGEFVTIIGSNGAGKSTLFNAICGTFLLNEGRIVLDGRDITLLKEHKRALNIGRVFQDSLASTGLNPYKLVVTSVLRTEEDVARLRKGNINASENSTHRYGTTFDLSYWRYVKIPELRGRPYEDVPPEYLRAVLSQVLKDFHDKGNRCYIKYEKKQNCFHITTRR